MEFEIIRSKRKTMAAQIIGNKLIMQLKPIETAKINCARSLFNDISTSKVRYEAVNNYQQLLNVINSME